LEPSERVIVARSLAVAPAPAVGAPAVVSGGQAVAQAPAQVDLVLVSEPNRYSERPALSVRKLAPSLERTSTADAGAPPPAAGEAGAGAELLEPLEPPELQAAARTAAAASGPPTLNIKEALLDETS
jgi:hypothetical protein